MALHHEDIPWADGPIPPELMDEPDGIGELAELVAAAHEFAHGSEVPVSEAVEMLADAEPERWRVRNDDDAEWALRHVAAAEAQLAELEARARRWQERIQAWFEHAAKDPARTAEFFTAHVEWYARTQRRETDRKSIALPSGTVKTRATAATAEIIDPLVLVEWAVDHLPEIVRTRTDVLVSTLRGRVKIVDGQVTAVTVDSETGEVETVPVPGTAVHPERVSVTVEAAT